MRFIAVSLLIFMSVPASAEADAPCRRDSFPQDQPPIDGWTIFFDQNGVAIGVQAAAILNDVGEVWRRLPQSHCPIEISGHTDRSGTVAYNRLLSRRRAEAVADYLRRHGVTSVIRTRGLGETRLLVETRDGVSEPQNRRAEVVIVPNP